MPGPDDDHRLVGAARRGDDRAFEALYGRHHRAVAAYVLTMVRDRWHAEDVTQEVFLSAFRRMRETDRPIAFAPWIFAIARNACIDHFRRSQRAQEVPLDGDEGGSLAGSAPTPDAVVGVKQELDHLRGAFGGLSDSQHEVLVMRELEGLSQREIGERMGLSRAAVESTLSRARRRLAEEYHELASGARCRRIQRTIASASAAGIATRESNRLARHVAHCQPCRREALAAGIDPSLLTYVPLRRRAADRIAALLPLPVLARLLRGRAGGADAGTPVATQAQGLAEQLHAGWGKAAAIVAILVAGATGAGTQLATDPQPEAPAQTRPAAERARAAAEPVAAAGAARIAGRSGERENGAREARRASDRTDRPRRAGRGDGGAEHGRPAPADSPPGGAPAPRAEDEAAARAGGGDGGSTAGGAGGSSSPGAPAADDTPTGGAPPPRTTLETGIANTVGNTLDGVDETVEGVTGGLGETLNGVDQTLQGSPQGLDQTLQGVNQTVDGATGGLGSTLEGATDGLDETLAGIGDLLGPPR